jgi:hypothetical protein
MAATFAGKAGESRAGGTAEGEKGRQGEGETRSNNRGQVTGNSRQQQPRQRQVAEVRNSNGDGDDDCDRMAVSEAMPRIVYRTGRIDRMCPADRLQAAGGVQGQP